MTVILYIINDSHTVFDNFLTLRSISTIKMHKRFFFNLPYAPYLISP